MKNNKEFVEWVKRLKTAGIEDIIVDDDDNDDDAVEDAKYRMDAAWTRYMKAQQDGKEDKLDEDYFQADVYLKSIGITHEPRILDHLYNDPPCAPYDEYTSTDVDELPF